MWLCIDMFVEYRAMSNAIVAARLTPVLINQGATLHIFIRQLTFVHFIDLLLKFWQDIWLLCQLNGTKITWRLVVAKPYMFISSGSLMKRLTAAFSMPVSAKDLHSFSLCCSCEHHLIVIEQANRIKECMKQVVRHELDELSLTWQLWAHSTFKIAIWCRGISSYFGFIFKQNDL